MVSYHTRIKPLFLFVFILLLPFLFSVFLIADDHDGVLSRADYYAEVTFEHAKALDLLYRELEHDPGNGELLWRISRAYADSGEVVPEKPREMAAHRLMLFEKAVEYADRAIAANPASSMAYTQRAIAIGQVALYRGIWTAIDLVKQTREAIEKAIELDDDNSIAHYVLARTHAEVSERPRIFRAPLGLGWANLSTAIDHYEKAVSLWPEFIMFRLDAARAYVERKEYEKAREHLSVILSGLPTLNQLDDRYREEAAELMDTVDHL